MQYLSILRLLILCFWLVGTTSYSSLSAQFGQFDFFSGKKSVNVPFEYRNGFIVVNIIFGGFLPLKFILDTGAENTILAKSEVATMLGLQLEKEIRIVGSDMKTEIVAYVTRRVPIQMGSLKAPYNDILVLQDDYLHFEEFIGEEIYGIIGANFFRHFVVEINYAKHRITFTSKKGFKTPGKKYSKTPITVRNFRPYINAEVKLHNDTIVQTRLLLDTGASLSLLLHNSTHPDLKLPPNTIKGQVGMGLGGYLEGYLGRVRNFSLGKYVFNNVLTNFQDLNYLRDTSFLRGRNGLVGNDILSRFTVVIDYPGEMLYLRPRKKWDRGFKYDRSGISVIATGKYLNHFTINNIIKGSPADEAGLRAGDEIVRVNGFSAKFLGLHGINKRFQKKVGKKIRIVIRRQDEKHKFIFYLRELI